MTRTHEPYTKDMLAPIVVEAKSKAEILRKLGLRPVGGNYATITKYLTEFDLSTEHFTGQGWSKGHTPGPKRNVQEYLNNKIKINSYELKKRLLKEDILQPVCNSCNLTQWLGEPIPLELDHISGERLNNNLSNLRLLCPNCHAKTPTYRGKNIKKQNDKSIKRRRPYHGAVRTQEKCIDCGCTRSRESKARCKACNNKNIKFRIISPKTKITWPDVDWLLERLETTSYEQMGKELGVSGNAIRKHLKRRSK